MAGNGNHCSFVLLAEFHILEGAQLKYQFPQPLGIDEGYYLCQVLTQHLSMLILRQCPSNVDAS